MGDFKQHSILGLSIMTLLYLSLLYFKKMPPLNYMELTILGIIIILYSNMPDVDMPNSTTSNIMLIAFGMFSIYSFLNEEKLLGVISILLIIFFRVVHHRTLVHSLLFAVLFSIPLYFLGWIYFLTGFLSYAIHITSEGELSLFTDGDIRWINIWR